MNEIDWRKIFALGVFAACGLALLIGVIGLFGKYSNPLSLGGWVLFGYAAIIFTLFGFFSSMMQKKSPMVAQVGMIASAVALLFSVLMVLGAKIDSEFLMRVATLAFVASVGIGYINLLQSMKDPAKDLQAKLIDYSSLAMAVVVAFSVLGVIGVNLQSGFLFKLVALCSLSAFLGGISTYVMGRMDEVGVELTDLTKVKIATGSAVQADQPDKTDDSSGSGGAGSAS